MSAIEVRGKGKEEKPAQSLPFSRKKKKESIVFEMLSK